MENKPSSPKAVKISLLVVLIVAAGSVYLNIRQAGQINNLKDPNALAQSEIQKTMREVSKLIVLPSNETPTLATVSDLSKLKDQPFFEHAEIGDQVIIFSTARKAILWRPSQNKIVEVAPLTMNSQSAAVANAPASTVSAPTQAAQSPSPSTTPAPTTTPKPKR